MPYKVQVISYNFEEVVKEFECETLRQAERVDVGLSMNLNHDDYFTNIIKESNDE